MYIRLLHMPLVAARASLVAAPPLCLKSPRSAALLASGHGPRALTASITPPLHPRNCSATPPAYRRASSSSSRATATPVTMRTSGDTSVPSVVAIDGPAASGKGSLAKQLANHCRLAHLDTGLLYRAVGYKALRQGVSLEDEAACQAVSRTLQASDLSDPQLRSDAAASAASKVSVLPAVRAALKDYPRQFAANLPEGCKGAVIDGRDVGTHLFPDAPVKLFLVASPEVRATRRLAELQSRGFSDISLESVLKELRERDERDSNRKEAPLRPAPDAVILDTSHLSEEQVLAAALDQVQKACPWMMP